MADNKYHKLPRLLTIINLLNNNPDGLTAQQIAEKCKVTVRTAFRDLKTIDNELDIKLTDDNGKWKLLKGQPLPPVRFNYEEAIIMFLALRLLLNFTNIHIPEAISIFSKLISVLPGPLNNQINSISKSFKKSNKLNKHSSIIMASLSLAWREGRKMKIQYLNTDDSSTEEMIVEPYIVHSFTPDQDHFLIARDINTDEVRIFEMNRIHKIQVLDEHYVIPESFNPFRFVMEQLRNTPKAKV
jgi:predicted DNA-binding transcriptional regulator YafY